VCHQRRGFVQGFESDPARSSLQQHEQEEAWEEARRRGREDKAWWAGHREKKVLTEKVQEVVAITRYDLTLTTSWGPG